jgi:hypothetical protein
LIGKRKAVAHLGIVSLIVVIVGISAFAIYYGYTIDHSSASANAITLQSFSLNPATPSLAGTINVESNSQISMMSLYINGTYMGSFNYGEMRSMMNTMMGGNYPYMFSMMYSATGISMPMMANYHFVQNRAYTITMMAAFEDGTHCNATIIVRS